ncbi:MAG: N-succinylarginine dihydrolase [Chlamydiae bacterium]|nr:N-succinylarginine dihydrolase [Chlamydiota bacterium]
MIPIGYDVNFNGLVGPTYNFSGLSQDNEASVANRNQPSNPKAAALQVLEMMKFLSDLGIRQAVLPPHERPHIPTFRALGFGGSDRTIPEKVYQEMPEILLLGSSASSMWAANVATITPSIDSIDHKVHITPTNMSRTVHRTIETEFTAKTLKLIFPSTAYFTHHPALPFGKQFADEGSANQCHFCSKNNHTGIHLFVYGDTSRQPYPPREGISARQTLEASQTLARSHRLNPERIIFAQQSTAALEAGIFHNDLISVGTNNLFFFHERAFEDEAFIMDTLRDKVKEHCDTDMYLIKVPNEEISLRHAIQTYLFNSQLIKLPDGAFTLIAPAECQTFNSISRYLDNLTKDPEIPLRDIHYINIRESMRNGGGPACLRLPAILTQNEINAMHPNIFLTERLYTRLINWIEKHFREHLEPKDLADPNLVDETQQALDELTKILDLGKIYSFQV